MAPGSASYLDSLPTRKEEDLVAMANETVKFWREARAGLEQEWIANMAYLVGEQDISWRTLQSVSRVSRAYQPGNPRYIIHNLILPRFRAYVSRLVRGNIPLSASPQTDDPEDRATALVATKRLEQIWHDNNCVQLEHDLAFWLATTGWGFIQSHWNPHRGPEVKDLGRLGDIECRIRSPFDVYPDPEATSWEDCRFLVLRSVWSRHRLGLEFGLQLAGDIETPAPSPSGYFQMRFFGEGGHEKMGVWLDEIYVRPNAIFPQGQFLIVANEKEVLKRGTDDADLRKGKPTLPYEHQDFPVVEVRSTITRESFWGMGGWIGALRGPQEEWNRIRTAGVLQRENWVGNKVMMEEDAMTPVEAAKFREPGPQLIYVRDMSKLPQPWNAAQPHPYADELSILAQEFDLISSQNAPSRGQSTPAVRSGRQVALLQSAADLPMLMQAALYDSAWERAGQQWMAISHQKDKVERLVEVVGADREDSAKLFLGSAWEKVAGVSVESRPYLSPIPTEREAQVLRLWGSGFIDAWGRREFGAKVAVKLLGMKPGEWNAMLQDSVVPEGPPPQAMELLRQLGGGGAGQPLAKGTMGGLGGQQDEEMIDPSVLEAGLA